MSNQSRYVTFTEARAAGEVMLRELADPTAWKFETVPTDGAWSWLATSALRKCADAVVVTLRCDGVDVVLGVKARNVSGTARTRIITVAAREDWCELLTTTFDRQRKQHDIDSLRVAQIAHHVLGADVGWFQRPAGTDNDSEDAVFTTELWRRAVGEGVTRQGYWTWVRDRMDHQDNVAPQLVAL